MNRAMAAFASRIESVKFFMENPPPIAVDNAICISGREHVDWMHVGDSTGLADCAARVHESVAAKDED